jgi:cell wall-associated NlpC family hydrolase
MLMFEILLNFLGQPYRYGGNSMADGGLDCSGLVLIALKSYGVVESKADLTAQGIYYHVVKNSHQMVDVHNIKANDLLFWGKGETRISHVSMAVDSWRHIESGGGNRHTKDLKTAAKQRACVRIRPVRSRKDLVAVVRLNI